MDDSIPINLSIDPQGIDIAQMHLTVLAGQSATAVALHFKRESVQQTSCSPSQTHKNTNFICLDVEGK